jgi:hypothetical protein
MFHVFFLFPFSIFVIMFPSLTESSLPFIAYTFCVALSLSLGGGGGKGRPPPSVLQKRGGGEGGVFRLEQLAEV